MKHLKLLNKLILILIISIYACISLVIFVGCSNNDYEISDAYVVFEDGIGNQFKVEGEKRNSDSTSVRVFSHTIYYDYDPEAVYSFTANMYLKEGDKKLDNSSKDLTVDPLYFTDAKSYNNISDDGYRLSIFGEAPSGTIPLYGNEPGTYYMFKKRSYDYSLSAGVVNVEDFYFIIVHINGDNKEAKLNAVFEDDKGNSYTVEGSERVAGDDSVRVFSKTITYDSAPDTSYTFTGGLYYPDSGEKVKAGEGTYLSGNGFYNGLIGLTQINEYTYNELKKGHIDIHEIGYNKINGDKTRTYYFLLGAQYNYGGKYEDFDGVRLMHDYYVLIVEIK